MDADGANVNDRNLMSYLSGRPMGNVEAMLGLGHEIYVMNADGTRWQVSRFPRRGSPDGKKILYTAAIEHEVVSGHCDVASEKA